MVRSAGPPEEENFAEGVAAVLKSLNPPTPESSVLDVLNAPEAQKLTATSPSFWYTAHAIHTFYTKHNELPLPGAVPDMKAVSADYIALQNIYKTKAREDCAEVTATVRSLEKQYQRPADMAVDNKEIEAFCKGAAHIKLFRGRSTALSRVHKPLTWDEESAKAGVNALLTATAISIPDNGILIYIAFLAYDSFLASHNLNELGGEPRVPGLNDSDVEADGAKVVSTACAIFDAMIKAAGTFMENPGYDEAKEEVAKICREL